MLYEWGNDVSRLSRGRPLDRRRENDESATCWTQIALYEVTRASKARGGEIRRGGEAGSARSSVERGSRERENERTEGKDE